MNLNDTLHRKQSVSPLKNVKCKNNYNFSQYIEF